MNRNKRLFKDLQLFTAPAIARSNAEALIPTQESHDIIQGAVEQSAVLQRGRKLANMTASQYKMPVLDLLPVAYFVNGEGGSAMKQTTNMAWDKKVIYAEEIVEVASHIFCRIHIGIDIERFQFGKRRKCFRQDRLLNLLGDVKVVTDGFQLRMLLLCFFDE